MKSNTLKQLILYRYRYVLAYILFLVSLAAFLLLELSSVPAGLSQPEIDSAAQSAHTSLRELKPVIDLPYHLLQKASIHMLGLTDLAVRLPSAVVAFLTGTGILLLLHRWFKPNIAVIAAIIATTNSIFLVTGRTGVPMIMTLFFGVYILLLSTLVAQEAKGLAAWKILLIAVAGLSLYTPLSIYILIAAMIAGLLHPHTRYVLQRFGSVELLLGSLMFAALMIPLVLVGIRSDFDSMIKVGYQLLAIPGSMPSLSDYLSNGWQALQKMGDFLHPTIGSMIQPAFTMVSLILIVLGIVRTLLDNFAARTYALLIWTAILIPLTTLDTGYLPVVFLPAMLYMAVGMQALVNEWYSIFPYNPYARTVALLPLAALIGGLWFLNYSTYFYGHRYAEATGDLYSQDLSLLNVALEEKSANNTRVDVVVPARQHAFYKPLTRNGSNIRILRPDSALSPHARYVIVAEELAGTANYGLIDSLMANDRKEASLRWRIYQPPVATVVQ